MDFFSNFGGWLEENTALASIIAGSCVSAYYTEVKTWRERLSCIVFGVVTAICLSDFPMHWLPFLGEKATCFLTGYFGLNICAAFLKSVRRFGDDADFWTLLRELVVRAIDRFLPAKKEREE